MEASPETSPNCRDSPSVLFTWQERRLTTELSSEKRRGSDCVLIWVPTPKGRSLRPAALDEGRAETEIFQKSVVFFFIYKFHPVDFFNYKKFRPLQNEIRKSLGIGRLVTKCLAILGVPKHYTK